MSTSHEGVGEMHRIFRIRVKLICLDGSSHFIGLESRRGLPLSLRFPDGEPSGVTHGGAPGPCSIPDDWAERIDRELRDRFEHWHRMGYVELRAIVQ